MRDPCRHCDHPRYIHETGLNGWVAVYRGDPVSSIGMRPASGRCELRLADGSTCDCPGYEPAVPSPPRTDWCCGDGGTWFRHLGDGSELRIVPHGAGVRLILTYRDLRVTSEHPTALAAKEHAVTFLDSFRSRAGADGYRA